MSVTGGSVFSAVADTFRNVTTSVTDSVRPGTYTFSILSAIGCSYDTVITISNPSGIRASATSIMPTCVGGSDGTLTIAGSNGLAPYQYAIASTAFTSTGTFTGLSAGSYVIHVKDTGGCTLDTFFSVANPPDIYTTVAFGKAALQPLCYGRYYPWRLQQQRALYLCAGCRQLPELRRFYRPLQRCAYSAH